MKKITADDVLRVIEDIPETSENFTQRREAIRKAKALIEQEQS